MSKLNIYLSYFNFSDPLPKRNDFLKCRPLYAKPADRFEVFCSAVCGILEFAAEQQETDVSYMFAFSALQY